MKARLGFVSNSSSSSFLVGTMVPLSFEFLCSEFVVAKHPASELLSDLALTIAKKSKKITPDRMKEFEQCDDKTFNRMAAKFPHMYQFRASNEDDGVETWLYNFFSEKSGIILSDNIEVSAEYSEG
jgi:hypothetical protein